MSTQHTTWLWPDHRIGMRESRRLREEHNALVDSHAELLVACKELLAEWDARNDELCASEPGTIGYPDTGGIVAARDAVASAAESESDAGRTETPHERWVANYKQAEPDVDRHGVDRSPDAEADRVDAAYERMVDEQIRYGPNPHASGSGQTGEPR